MRDLEDVKKIRQLYLGPGPLYIQNKNGLNIGLKSLNLAFQLPASRVSEKIDQIQKKKF